jgi:hypothetical protein
LFRIALSLHKAAAAEDGNPRVGTLTVSNGANVLTLTPGVGAGFERIVMEGVDWELSGNVTLLSARGWTRWM